MAKAGNLDAGYFAFDPLLAFKEQFKHAIEGEIVFIGCAAWRMCIEDDRFDLLHGSRCRNVCEEHLVFVVYAERRTFGDKLCTAIERKHVDTCICTVVPAHFFMVSKDIPQLVAVGASDHHCPIGFIDEVCAHIAEHAHILPPQELDRLPVFIAECQSAHGSYLLVVAVVAEKERFALNTMLLDLLFVKKIGTLAGPLLFIGVSSPQKLSFFT